MGLASLWRAAPWYHCGVKRISNFLFTCFILAGAITAAGGGSGMAIPVIYRQMRRGANSLGRMEMERVGWRRCLAFHQPCLAPAILCPPSPQSALRPNLPSKRRNAGFTVFRSSNMNDLAPAFTPAASNVRVPRFKSEATDCVPFGSSPISIFGLLNLTMLAAVYLHWTCHPA